MAVRVLHLITGLETGGAETALTRLLLSMDGDFDCRVVSLVRPGFAGERLAASGVPVEHLSMQRGIPSPAAVLRLSGMLRSFRPHLLQTWLYHADLLGLLAAALAVGVKVPVAWNLRCSYMDFSKYSRTTAWTVRACALLSRLPKVVVANSSAALEHHRSLGYRPRRAEVISNGIDTDRFRPDSEAGVRLRREFGLEAEATLAGMAARYDHMKGFPVLLEAMARVAGQVPGLHLLLCGQDVDETNAELAAFIDRHGLRGRVHLAGHRPDLERVLPGLDLYVSSSLGESFPNVVAEAMACGVPVVATDAGASKALVDDPARIVPPGDAAALAGALGALAGLDNDARKTLGIEGRSRIVQKYSLAASTACYEALYREFADRS